MVVWLENSQKFIPDYKKEKKNVQLCESVGICRPLRGGFTIQVTHYLNLLRCDG